MMVVTPVCAAVIISAAGALLLLLSPYSAFAQQEETSLGERENLASVILSNVLHAGLGGGDVDEGDQKKW